MPQVQTSKKTWFILPNLEELAELIANLLYFLILRLAMRNESLVPAILLQLTQVDYLTRRKAKKWIKDPIYAR
jgi:hypothetical protein